MHFNELRLRSYKVPPNLVYRGKWIWNWFSNMEKGSLKLRLGDVVFDAVENGYQASKSLSPAFRRTVAGVNPHASKPMGRAVALRPDWEHVNIAAMDFFLRQKWVPGTPEFDRLLCEVFPIVEFNNWYDRRFGVTIDNGRGRNALGLLLALIVIEHHDGGIQPGAPEERWAERQVELIARMNALPDYGIVFGQPSQAEASAGLNDPPSSQQLKESAGDNRQMDLF